MALVRNSLSWFSINRHILASTKKVLKFKGENLNMNPERLQHLTGKKCPRNTKESRGQVIMLFELQSRRLQVSFQLKQMVMKPSEVKTSERFKQLHPTK